MPIMPRPEGVGKRVAYNILGVPNNMETKRATKKQTRIKKILLAEDTFSRNG